MRNTCLDDSLYSTQHSGKDKHLQGRGPNKRASSKLFPRKRLKSWEAALWGRVWEVGGSKLTMSTWCGQQERQPTAPVCVNRGMAQWPREKGHPSPCGTHQSRQGIEVWALQCRKHMGKLEGALEGFKPVGTRVLGIWAEVGAGLLHPGEEITLGAPHSPSVPSRGHQGDRTGFLIVVQDGRMRHKCPYMELESSRLDLRERFFPHEDSLKMGQVVQSDCTVPLLFKIQLDKSLSSLVWCHSLPCFEQGCEPGQLP